MEPEPAGAAVVFGERIDLARRYAQALASDGVVRGLIGPREPERLWTRHLLNSAALAAVIGEAVIGEAVIGEAVIGDAVTVVDIGSGAGLPGIPLAIARPDLRVTLVEPLERRVRFLLEVVAELQLTGCRVIRGRADEVIADCGNADVVTSRAVAPLHRLAEWSAPLARDGGVMLALKGATAAEELDRDRAALTAAGLVDAEVLGLVVSAGGVGTVDPADAGEEAQTTGDADGTFVVRARRSVVPAARRQRPARRPRRRSAGR